MPLRSRPKAKRPGEDRDCPRCGATASRVLGQDQYGKYIQCLSCSASEDMPEDKRVNLPFARSRVVRRVEDWGKSSGSGGVE